MNRPAQLSDLIARLEAYDPDALPVAHARQLIDQFVVPLDCVEQVAIRAALDRVLARDLISPIDVPAHDNSAMDGYALRGTDLSPDAQTRLAVVGTAFAGQPFAGATRPGQAVRIMTGAVMPDDMDTVVVQEVVQLDGDAVIVPPGQQPGQNRRLRGEDLTAGRAAIAAGRILRPADLGLIASLGIAEVPVQRPLRIAFFSTGNELRSLGEPLGPGEIYDSNRYTIYGMLRRLGAEVIDMGVVRDDPVALERALREAGANADAIISSGGVSVGEADFTREVMEHVGDIAFWKIAMRPGRPMAFGRVGQAYFFGLPGNPVAVMITFYGFVRDALLRLAGAAPRPLPLVPARTATPFRKRPGRTEFQRAIVGRDAAGALQVRSTGSQGSGVLRSMSEANCLVVLHHDQGSVQVGDAVDVLLFEGLV